MGLVHSSDPYADFTSSAFQARGAGYSRRLSPDVDSVIAAQGTAQFGSRFTVVAQILSQESYDDTYRPQVEWANVQYHGVRPCSNKQIQSVAPHRQMRKR